MTSTKQLARRAGLLYLLLGITAPIALVLVPGKLIVSGDAATTADRIRASESLFRLGIGSELVCPIIAIFLVLALFRLFKTVSETLAWQLVILGALMPVPIMLVNVLNSVAALTLVSGPDFLSMFDRSQLDALAHLFLNLHTNGIDLTYIFAGLWLFPFGLLVIRSGFIPRFLGYLLFIAGVGYVVQAFTTFVLPQVAPHVEKVATVTNFCELPIIFWLLIWGAREPVSATS